MSRRSEREGGPKTRVPPLSVDPPVDPPGGRLGRGIAVAVFVGGAATYLILGVKATLFVVGPGLMNAVGTPTGTDFVTFYVAALQAAAGKATEVYDITRFYAVQESVLMADYKTYAWQYPPQFLLYVLPLALVGFIPALWTWLTATVGALALVAYRLAPHPAVPPLVVIFSGVAQGILEGGSTNLAVVLFGAGLLVLRRYPLASGVLFGLMAFKPHLALLVPVCLLGGRHYKVLAAMAATGAALFLLSVAAFGIDIWFAFLEKIPASIAYVVERRVPLERMPTLFVSVFLATGSVAWAQIVQGVGTVAAIVACAWTWARTSDFEPRTLVLAVSLPLATPYLYDYDLAFFAVPLALMIGRAFDRGLDRRETLLLAVLWPLPLIFQFLAPWTNLQVGPVIFVIMLAYVLSRVPGAAAKAPPLMSR